MTYKIGISTIIIRGDKILVGKRGPDCKRGAGYYAFPNNELGGKLDGDETIVQAAAREVLEETGLKVDYREITNKHTHTPDHTLPRPYEAPIIAVTEHSPLQRKLTFWLAAYYTATDQNAHPVNKEPNKCLGWEWVTIDRLNSYAYNIPHNDIGPRSEQYYWIPMPLLRNKIQPLLQNS